MEGLIVILLYAFKLAFLASLACVKTNIFSLKSEAKKAYLHAHKRILIMPSILQGVYVPSGMETDDKKTGTSKGLWDYLNGWIDIALTSK